MERFMATELLKGIQPFWFWNGEMDHSEIVRQIREMAEQGIKGFLIHPRQGMELPYLTEEYFDRVKTAVAEAKKHGMEVWLYDEYPYPSGVSAGQVMLDHPEYCCKALTKTVGTVTGPQTLKLMAPWGNVLSARAYRVKDGRCDFSEFIDLMDYIGTGYADEIFQLSGLTAYNRKRFFTGTAAKFLRWNAPQGEWKVYVFVEEVMKHFKYFENFVDPLNPEAIRYFLETTHEKYKKSIGDEFGKTVKGVFTDEVTAFPPQQPWSGLLPALIQKKYGRNIIDCLPALTEDMGPETQKIRFEYWDTVTDAFIESYDKQVYEWCEKNHLMYIGEKPILRSKELEYVHVPGTDAGHAKVGAKANPLPGKYRANGKIISSAAHFYHKPAALCEAFHSIGWGMTMQDMKWIFDWLAMSGVDWYIQHAYYYTTDGLKKHDAPPSSFCQMPWWKNQKKLSLYADGLGTMLGQMRRHVKTLMVDPATSLWVLEREQKKDQEEALSAVMNSLIRCGCDFYVADPQLLTRAAVKKQNGRAVLELMGESYESVVLPNMNNIEDCAFKVLRRFAEEGGLLVCAGSVPVYNVQKEEAAQWFAQAFASGQENLLRTDLETAGPVLAQKLAGLSWKFPEQGLPEGVYAITGTDAQNGELVFAVNTTPEPVAVQLFGSMKGTLYQRDLETMQDTPAGPFTGTLEIHLEPWASCVYTVRREAQTLQSAAAQELNLPFEAGDWQITRNTDNALYLGRWRLSLPDGQSGMTGCYPIIDQMEELGMKMPVKTVPYFGCPKELMFLPADCRFETDFGWNLPPESAAYLVMEPETLRGDWRLEINGHEITQEAFRTHPFYLNTNLAADIHSYLRQGTNHVEVRIRCSKNYDGLRNPLYIFGDFGVEAGSGRQTAVPAKKSGPFHRPLENGLPFYAGDVIYSRQIRMEKKPDGDVRVNLNAPGLQDAVRLVVNGLDCGVSAWNPRELTVAQRVWKTGDNQVELIVSNTLAGLFEGQYFNQTEHKYVQVEDEKTDVTAERTFTAW